MDIAGNEGILCAVAGRFIACSQINILPNGQTKLMFYV
jgi:hypothetical protein